MNLEISSIHNQGDAKEEYVLLVVKDDTDLCFYKIADTTYVTTGKISNKLRHYYWFSSKNAKKGDFVKLHTGTGTNRSVDNKAGTKTHHFYWGLKSAVWNNAGDGAVLFCLSEWETTKTT